MGKLTISVAKVCVNGPILVAFGRKLVLVDAEQVYCVGNHLLVGGCICGSDLHARLRVFEEDLARRRLLARLVPHIEHLERLRLLPLRLLLTVLLLISWRCWLETPRFKGPA